MIEERLEMTGRQEVFQNAMNEGHSAAWDQNWERAAAFYSQAVEEFPDHPGALANLGLALYELQKFEDALICYQKAARLSPADPLPIDRIALICQRLGKLEQAIQSSLKAAELFFQNRDVEKALENWNRVIRLQPENMTARSRLAMTLERMGQTDAAVNEFLAVASRLLALILSVVQHTARRYRHSLVVICLERRVLHRSGCRQAPGPQPQSWRPWESSVVSSFFVPPVW